MPRHVAEDTPLSAEASLITPKLVVEWLETRGEKLPLYGLFKATSKLDFKVDAFYRIWGRRHNYIHEQYENVAGIDEVLSSNWAWDGSGIRVKEGEVTAEIVSKEITLRHVPDTVVHWKLSEPQNEVRFYASRDSVHWTELISEGEPYNLTGELRKAIRTKIVLTSPAAMILAWILGWRR